MSTDQDWWRGAVIYQIYPRSFAGQSEHGTGTLKGITEKMPYIADLGVDAIWISPFFKSPGKDYGYDVSDYRAVDPMFGTNKDFEDLIGAAHAAGLKVITDYVLNHTSDQHEWFLESRSSRTNPKADWYVWADPKPDGSPPNNWAAHFGGDSWTWCEERGQYYFHNFLAEQPDLNLYNHDVRKEIFNIAEYWMERGVDGFRLDAAAHLFHDLLLRDNPPRTKPIKGAFGAGQAPTQFNSQIHKYDIRIRPALAFLEQFRTVLDKFGAMSIAEVGSERGVRLSAEYTNSAKRLHTAYSFEFISANETKPSLIRDVIKAFNQKEKSAWPSWAFSNHDSVRVASRLNPRGNGYDHDPRLSKMLIALLGSLRGTSFIYQGEELGLPEAKIPQDRVVDPMGLNRKPPDQGRDGARTPMPWTNEKPQNSWLPMPDNHLPLNVAAQEKDPYSVLNFTREFLQWRKNNEVIKLGDIVFKRHKPSQPNLLEFTRSLGEQSLTCRFNLAAPYDFQIEGFHPASLLPPPEPTA